MSDSEELGLRTLLRGMMDYVGWRYFALIAEEVASETPVHTFGSERIGTESLGLVSVSLNSIAKEILSDSLSKPILKNR
jgi:hypothetical protein